MVTPQFLTDVRRARRTELQSLLIFALDELANEDHAYTATRAERKRHEHNWVLKLNTQSPLVPSGLRSDYPGALRRLQELRSQDGDEKPKVHPHKEVRQRADHSFMRGDEALILSTKKPVVLRSRNDGETRESHFSVDLATRLRWYSSPATSSSSATWFIKLD